MRSSSRRLEIILPMFLITFYGMVLNLVKIFFDWLTVLRDSFCRVLSDSQQQKLPCQHDPAHFLVMLIR